jgi:hypothetical protein
LKRPYAFRAEAAHSIVEHKCNESNRSERNQCHQAEKRAPKAAAILAIFDLVFIGLSSWLASCALVAWRFGKGSAARQCVCGLCEKAQRASPNG